MNLKAEREALKATLTGADVHTFAKVPGRFTPPVAIVVPGSPYVEQGDTFGTSALRFDVWLAAPSGELAEDTLDDLIDTATGALTGESWDIETVTQPFDWSPTSGGNHLASIISIRGQIPA